jgi:hypothetical protein
MTEKKGPMLHELLAVLGDLEGKFKRVVEEGHDTFSKKRTHFLGYHKTLRMFDERDKQQEAAGEEHKEITDTVVSKLNYLKPDVVRLFDGLLQKEATNQNAKADLVVNGVTLGADLPATWLLSMEAKLKELRGLYEAIPTLDPGVKWEKDTQAAEGIYRAAHPEVKAKTMQEVAYKILVPATTEHPAQVETWKENKPVGEYITQMFSGCVTPHEKSVMLGRIDDLLRAVKKARMRANNTPALKITIGKKIMEYIHNQEITGSEED